MKQVLVGMYEVPLGMNEHAQSLIEFLKLEEPIRMAPPVSTVLTLQEYIQGWWKGHKVTSFGPSGFHFSYAKTVFEDRLLAEVQATMTNIPFPLGYSPC